MSRPGSPPAIFGFPGVPPSVLGIPPGVFGVGVPPGVFGEVGSPPLYAGLPVLDDSVSFDSGEVSVYPSSSPSLG